jgi:hypothetical protein
MLKVTNLVMNILNLVESVTNKLNSLHFTEDFARIQYKQDAFGGIPKEWPPYNGWGSEEDSLCSCMGLLPKPPKRDFIKVSFMLIYFTV